MFSTVQVICPAKPTIINASQVRGPSRARFCVAEVAFLARHSLVWFGSQQCYYRVVATENWGLWRLREEEHGPVTPFWRRSPKYDGVLLPLCTTAHHNTTLSRHIAPLKSSFKGITCQVNAESDTHGNGDWTETRSGTGTHLLHPIPADGGVSYFPRRQGPESRAPRRGWG